MSKTSKLVGGWDAIIWPSRLIAARSPGPSIVQLMSRYIPIHNLTQKLSEDIYNTIFKIHVLISYEANSKTGTKSSCPKS